jgi:hypothetical protein
MSSLVSRPEIFCWVLTGRPPRSEMLFVGQIRVSEQNRVTVLLAVAAEFQQVPAWVLGGGRLRAGDAAHIGEPGQHGVAELAQQWVPDARRDLGLAGVAGGMPPADQAAQRPLRLHRPDRGRIALGRVLVVPD